MVGESYLRLQFQQLVKANPGISAKAQEIMESFLRASAQWNEWRLYSVFDELWLQHTTYRELKTGRSVRFSWNKSGEGKIRVDTYGFTGTPKIQDVIRSEEIIQSQIPEAVVAAVLYV